MDLNRIHTFKILAELRSFSRTAEALHITQSAVSQQMKLLQEDLGFALVHKVNGFLELTPRGRNFFDMIGGPIATLTSELQKNKLGRLHAEYKIMGSYNYLSQVFAVQMKKIVPQGLLQFYVGNSIQCMDALQRGQIDFAVLSHPPKSKDILLHVLLEEEMVFVANPHLKISESTPLPIVAQDKQMSGYLKWAEINTVAKQYSPECFASIESIYGVINFILNMPCAGFVPEYLVADDVKQKKMKFAFKSTNNFKNKIYLCILKKQNTSEIGEIFEKFQRL